MTRSLPLVGVTACIRPMDDTTFHVVNEKYVNAVVEGAQAQPVLIPALGKENLEGLLAGLDGLFVTGSPSNIQPRLYGARPSPRGGPFDPLRDATALALIRLAVAKGVPLLGICRGCQEINVAFGGTLHQHLHEQPGRIDHRRIAKGSLDDQHGLRHGVRFTPGGMIAGIYGGASATVNSLHGQGIDALGQGIVVEAVADDGTIEAVRVANAPEIALGVQWHAEWRLRENPLSVAIFRHFAGRVRVRADLR
jgi:putative glutamine amidotransferase